MEVSDNLDAGSAAVMIIMGVVIMAPTVALILAIVIGRFRNPKDDP